jgi:hypothetical protein
MTQFTFWNSPMKSFRTPLRPSAALMRTICALVLASLALGLTLPTRASAARVTIVGSLTITGAGGAALTTELVGIALIANPGGEKSATIQIPPFVLPVVIDGEDGGPGARGKLLSKNLDTTLLLTNTTTASMTIELTVRDGDGTSLTTSPAVVTLGPRATKVVVVSDLLP